jgi:hypothetical protein
VSTAIVAGALANKAGNGGAAWTRLSWTLGLASLGFDVHFVEQLSPGAPANAEQWFTEVLGDFGLLGKATLLRPDGSTAVGLSRSALEDVADDADLLLNISGHLTDEKLANRPRSSVFVDLDPGYTQLWHQQGVAPLRPHDHWYTVGTRVGAPECRVPTDGIEWRAVLQPVVLEHWPVQPPVPCDRFTTVATWRGPFGPVDVEGELMGSKVHEFRQLIDLPSRVPSTLELCLQIDDGDDADRRSLHDHGWKVVPADGVANPHCFRRYVQQSPAELSVAQSVYARAGTGWVSDRSARYLASGRPVVVQETGISRSLETGDGIVTFDSPEGAARAVAAVAEDYERHAAAAREIACERFDARRVLGGLCEEVGVAP